MTAERPASDLDLMGLLQDGLRELIELVSSSGVSELQIERGSTKLYIKAGGPAAAPPLDIPAVPVTTSPSLAPSPVEAPPPVTGAPITAPLVGTYYASPNPAAEPYVRVGDFIEKGQTVGIIEAMKIMNEIESDVSGQVVDILAQDGQAVEYGQTLMLVDVTAQPGA